MSSQINKKLNITSLVTSVMSFYKEPITDFSIMVWQNSMAQYDFEQINKAFSAHLADPDRGNFMPKPADIVRLLSGTSTDRAKLAWGRVHEAARTHGGYRDVCFDDAAIHSSVQNMGGWPKVCATETDKLSYTQHQFCEFYRAYSLKPSLSCPKYLAGINGTGQNHNMFAKVGAAVPPVVMIGDVQACQKLMGVLAPSWLQLVKNTTDMTMELSYADAN